MCDLPDWLLSEDNEPELTAEDIQNLWQRLLSASLAGWQVNFANRGGDMWELKGTVESIFRRGEEVVMRLEDVEYHHRNRETDKLFLAKKVEREEFVLSSQFPPEFGKGEVRTVILQAGLDYYEEIDIGFLFPPADSPL